MAFILPGGQPEEIEDEVSHANEATAVQTERLSHARLALINRMRPAVTVRYAAKPVLRFRLPRPGIRVNTQAGLLGPLLPGDVSDVATGTAERNFLPG